MPTTESAKITVAGAGPETRTPTEAGLEKRGYSPPPVQNVERPKLPVPPPRQPATEPQSPSGGAKG